MTTDLIKYGTFAGYGVEFKPVSIRDLPILRRWRNSNKICEQMLDQKHINARSQISWFGNVSSCDKQAHWVVWCKGERTGHVNVRSKVSLAEGHTVNGGYYIAYSHVRHPLLGVATILMYHDIIFDHIKASQIYDSVRKGNLNVRKFNKQIGYKELSEHNEIIKITLNPDDYRLAHKKYFRYFKDTKCQQIS
jgi:hypothetical protein